MERAKELGRNLLSMARGGSTEEDGERGAPKRRSWSDVVSSPPPAANSSPVKTRTEIRAEAGMPKPSSSVNKLTRFSPGRESSSQKIFSADDVARLVEIARNQLRKEKELSSGWKEVTSRDSRNKEKNYARDVVEGYRSSPETPFKCWQCDLPGHKSADCPKGERCFTCNSQGHKRADCPLRRRATRKEKGKAIDVLEEAPRRRSTVRIQIADHRPPVGKHTHQEVGGNTKEYPKNTEKEWRKVPETKGKTPLRPGRQCEAGEATTTVLRPGRQSGTLHENNKAIIAKQPINVMRQSRGQPVFLIKSELALAERNALISNGGVVSKANGNPLIKDYIEALRKMSSTYANWKWNPTPIKNGILFKFPSEGGLNILTKREVIPCNNGHFVVTRWNEEKEGFTHNFPIKLAVLAFNLPPYLRAEPELARMVADFAHLIEAT